MTEQLDPTGGPIRLGSITLRTPGLSGTAESLPLPPAHAQHTRAMGGMLASSDALEQALAENELITQHAIRLEGTREETSRSPVTRSTRSGDAAMELEVPAPGPDMEQVVLVQDESGLHSWVFAEQASQQHGLTTRGMGATRTYLLRRHVPQVEAEPGQRGLIGAIGHKILRVLLFPIVRAGVRLVGPAAFAAWENHKRSYRLRTFTCQNAAHDDAPSLEPGYLDRFANQPILLLIHGTFSRTPSAFAELPAAFIDKLNAKYRGAVVSFDHPSLSQDPAQNVEQLFSLLGTRQDLTVDIICHSRGGLVARELAARGPARAQGKVHVRNLVFVASPNAGTILAQAEHMGDMIDAYTNLLHFLPGIGVADILSTVIAVVKEVAVGLDQSLPGLQSMNSQGKYLPNLTWPAAFAPKTYGLASNYTPIAPAGLVNYAKNFLLDRIFREANDLVVPTDGVFAKGVGIQPTCSMTYGADEGIAHTTFFKHQKVQDQLQTWLAL